MAPFTYIHVPGCKCSSAPDYQTQLAAARAELTRRLDCSEEEADRLAPDGSCVGWLAPERRQGWPMDHQNYNLLALHAEAVRCRAALAVATAAHRAVKIVDGWNPTEAERAEEGAAFDVLVTAQNAERVAMETLEEALGATPAGAQPDGSFVTRATVYGIATGRYRTTLHAPAKQGPLAEVMDPQHGSAPAYLRVVRTREEARAVREEERARLREDAESYEADRREAGAILAGGGSLLFHAGQKGGKVFLGDVGGDLDKCRTVAARGALVAAGWAKEAADAFLDAVTVMVGQLSLAGLAPLA